MATTVAVVVVPSLGKASTLSVVAPEVVLQATRTTPQAVAMVGGAGTVAKAGLKLNPKPLDLKS